MPKTILDDISNKNIVRGKRNEEVRKSSATESEPANECSNSNASSKSSSSHQPQKPNDTVPTDKQ